MVANFRELQLWKEKSRDETYGDRGRKNLFFRGKSLVVLQGSKVCAGYNYL